MSAEAIAHLDRVLPSSKFNIGEFLSQGFDLWKKGFWAFFGFGLLYMIILGVVSMIPYLGQIANQFILPPILVGGAYMYCHHLRRDGNAEFEIFFSQFKADMNLFIAYFIYTMITLLLAVPFILSIGFEIFEIYGTPEMINYFEDFDARKFLLIIPVILGSMLFGYVIHFVIFYKLSAIDAIRYSIKYCLKHYVLIIAYILIVFLIVMLGMLGLIIGILFTFPLLFTMSFESFRLLTKLDDFENYDEKKEVIDQLIV